MRLWFLHMKGCPACAMSRGPLARWEAKHPEVRVVRIDMLALKDGQWKASWKPTDTPTWVVQIPGRRDVMFAGSLDMKGIDLLVRKAWEMTGGGGPR